MPDPIAQCEAPGCEVTWQDLGDGRRFCGPTCRQRARRHKVTPEDEVVPMPEYLKTMRDQLLGPRRRGQRADD